MKPKTEAVRRKRLPKTKKAQKSPAVEQGENDPQTGDGHAGSGDNFTEVHPTIRQRLKWKPIKKTSIEFVDGILDQTVTNLLNNAKSLSYNMIQDSLNALRTRCVKRLGGKLAPSTAVQVNYETLHRTLATVEEQLTRTSAHLQKLEQELEIEERLKDQQKADLDKFVGCVDSRGHQRTVHPLLTGESSSVLGLPRLTKSSPSETAVHDMLFAKSLKFTTGTRVQELVTATAGLVETLPETLDQGNT